MKLYFCLLQKGIWQLKKRASWPLLISVCMASAKQIQASEIKIEHLESRHNNTQQTIKGQILDDSGNPISSATIQLKGSSIKTISDIDGKFEFANLPINSVLQISSVGYTSKEVSVQGNRFLEITLLPSSKDLEEVVVVGFGSQKKENLTGAVSSIQMSDVVGSRPITSLSSGLAGQAPGLSVTKGSGRPGADGGTLRVRGQGTLNNANPLVVIDGAVGDMNLINPQDVESISVLKDAASASIYGSRAANGVILITTKKGRNNDFKVIYNNYFSSQKPSNAMTMISNYADYMELINEGYKNGDLNAIPIFSQEKIDLWRTNENGDPLMYPNVDWVESLFQNKISQNHNLSFTGGSEKIKFFGSYGLLDNPGIIEQATYKRHTGRINLEVDIKPWLTLGANINGVFSKTMIGTNLINDVFLYAAASTPGMVLQAPDGRFGSPNNTEDDPQSNNILHRLNAQKGDINKNRFVNYRLNYTIIND